MKKVAPRVYGPAALLGLLLLCGLALAGEQAAREPILAGTWYPADPGELRGMIAGFLDKASQRPSPINPAQRLVALIAPHAGYRYSGPIAAHAFARLQGQHFSTAVVIGPSHRLAFDGVSVYDQGPFRTPLGLVPLDKELIADLKGRDPSIRFLAAAHREEHCLEIELPFLQTVLPRCRLVPLVMGAQDMESCRRLAQSLVEVIRTRPKGSILLLASSDLSHFRTSEQAAVLDKEVRESVDAFDPEKLGRDLASGTAEACGGGPIIAAMLAARSLGAEKSAVLAYGDSGDTSGDRTRVVGYMAAALFAASGK